MNITNDTEKIKIVDRLIKDGTIDFTEALKLLEEPTQIIWGWPVYPTYPVTYQPRLYEPTWLAEFTNIQ